MPKLPALGNVACKWRDIRHHSPASMLQQEGAWWSDRQMSFRSLLRGTWEMSIHRSADTEATRSAGSSTCGRTSKTYQDFCRSILDQSRRTRVAMHSHGCLLHLSEQGIERIGEFGRSHPNTVPTSSRHHHRGRPHSQGQCHILWRGRAGVPGDEQTTRSLWKIRRVYRTLNLRQQRHQESYSMLTAGWIQEDPTRWHEA